MPYDYWDWLTSTAPWLEARYLILKYGAGIMLCVTLALVALAHWEYWHKKRSARGSTEALVVTVLVIVVDYYFAYNLILSGFIIPIALAAAGWVGLTAWKQMGGFAAGAILFSGVLFLLFLDLYVYQTFHLAFLDLW